MLPRKAKLHVQTDIYNMHPITFEDKYLITEKEG